MKSYAYWLILIVTVQTSPSYGQVNCDDYQIVSIFDMPSSPQTPGGNFFLLLLTLNQDNLSNIDNYADLFFIDALGDTISIPTGPSSTLPRYASDTIPYILELNTTAANQDFPSDFNGELVIVHITQLICEVDYSNISTGLGSMNANYQVTVYPNPCVDFLNIESEKRIDNIVILGSDGRKVETSYPDTYYHQMNLEELRKGVYLMLIQFENGEIGTERVIKL